MRAEIIARNGDEITVRLIDELTDEEAKRYEINGRLYAHIELFGKNSITDAQRSHIFALLGDIKAHAGGTIAYWEDYTKYHFMKKEDLQEMPSFAANNMTKQMASDFIEFLVILCIYGDVPFRKEQMYLPKDNNRILYALTMNRLCWVCGAKNSSIHHATDLVGMGRDRTKHNHLKSKFMCLCEAGHDIEDETKSISHHQEVHRLGLTEFCKKYHVQPIKLDESSLKELNIRGNYKE